MFNKSKKFKIFDSDALKNFHKRIFFSIIVFSFFYSIAIFRIADVMAFDFKKNDNNRVVEKIERGKIYDRNGYLLASDIKGFSLYANASKIIKKSEISEKLSKILNITENEIFKKLNSNNRFVYIKRNITPIEHQKIINLGEINLKTELEKTRVYPYRNATSHLIGFVDVDNNGKAGVEISFDKSVKQNKNLYLSIDINLQNAVRNELIKTINQYSAESGSVIIMDIQNSEILSLINFPDFDPNNYKTSTNNQRLNRALQSNYEMGSTFKPLTVAIGLEQELINKDMIFDVSKPIKHIEDWDPCDCKLSLKDVIVKSSNIGIAQIAKIIGKENQKKFFQKAGFYKPIDIDLVEAAHPLGNRNNWGLMETMTIGFGYGFAITPMHLAVAYNAVLNDGKKLKPKILINDKNNSFSQLTSKNTSQFISLLLKAVVEESKYTGPRVKIDGYQIGGKTGTSEIPDNNGNYNSDSNRTIFISAFPMSKPKYLVLTIIDKPQRKKEFNNSITSATVNAPLVKSIIGKIIEILKLPKYENTPILNAATPLNYINNNAFN